ncbi:restriction endonuclease [Mucilaginibacter sp. P25]|uniref:Restriction endonuclease n=1 Tax=Mucilaginibacter gossypii TaxID=551996 RepID=A0A1G8DD81_9SPHI|nr:restriction endonuclease [Mucilaginibacter gossypii]SDH55678.1 Restriction endonuclease [Mucilaginibacter gossypii]
MKKRIDWNQFELFVAELYKDNDEVIVDHNVEEIGKSNAFRQIDVRVIHKTKLRTYKTIIEYKSWKHRVGRARIDVLAPSMEDLNASKGVFLQLRAFSKVR